MERRRRSGQPKEQGLGAVEPPEGLEQAWSAESASESEREHAGFSTATAWSAGESDREAKPEGDWTGSWGGSMLSAFMSEDDDDDSGGDSAPEQSGGPVLGAAWFAAAPAQRRSKPLKPRKPAPRPSTSAAAIMRKGWARGGSPAHVRPAKRRSASRIYAAPARPSTSSSSFASFADQRPNTSSVLSSGSSLAFTESSASLIRPSTSFSSFPSNSFSSFPSNSSLEGGVSSDTSRRRRRRRRRRRQGAQGQEWVSEAPWLDTDCWTTDPTRARSAKQQGRTVDALQWARQVRRRDQLAARRSARASRRGGGGGGGGGGSAGSGGSGTDGSRSDESRTGDEGYSSYCSDSDLAQARAKAKADARAAAEAELAAAEAEIARYEALMNRPSTAPTGGDAGAQAERGDESLQRFDNLAQRAREAHAALERLESFEALHVAKRREERRQRQQRKEAERERQRAEFARKKGKSLAYQDNVVQLRQQRAARLAARQAKRERDAYMVTELMSTLRAGREEKEGSNSDDSLSSDWDDELDVGLVRGGEQSLAMQQAAGGHALTASMASAFADSAWHADAGARGDGAANTGGVLTAILRAKGTLRMNAARSKRRKLAQWVVRLLIKNMWKTVEHKRCVHDVATRYVASAIEGGFAAWEVSVIERRKQDVLDEQRRIRQARLDAMDEKRAAAMQRRAKRMTMRKHGNSTRRTIVQAHKPGLDAEVLKKKNAEAAAWATAERRRLEALEREKLVGKTTEAGEKTLKERNARKRLAAKFRKIRRHAARKRRKERELEMIEEAKQRALDAEEMAKAEAERLERERLEKEAEELRIKEENERLMAEALAKREELQKKMVGIKFDPEDPELLQKLGKRWRAPDKERAMEKALHHIFAQGGASLTSVDHMALSDFFGVGVALFLTLVESVRAYYMRLMWLLLPVFMVCASGSNLRPRSEIENAMRLSFGNVGDDNAPSEASLFGTTVSPEVVSYVLVPLDLIISVMLFFWLRRLSAQLKQAAQKYVFFNVRPQHYAVWVTTDAPAISEHKIRIHFARRYGLSLKQPRYHNFLGLPLYRIWKAKWRPTGKHLAELHTTVNDMSHLVAVPTRLHHYYQNSWVAEVSPVSSDVTQTAVILLNGRRDQKIAELIYRYRFFRARRDPLRFNWLSRLRRRVLNKLAARTKERVFDLKRQIVDAQVELALKAKDSGQVTNKGFFVTFNNRESQVRCLKEYSYSTTPWGQHWQAPDLRIRDSRNRTWPLRVEPAPQPDDIIWPALMTRSPKAGRRLALVVVLTALLLGFNLAVLAAVTGFAGCEGCDAESGESGEGKDMNVPLVALLVSVLNELSSRAVAAITRLQHTERHTQRSIRTMVRVAAVRLCNSAVLLTMLSSAKFVAGGDLRDLGRGWFRSCGAVLLMASIYDVVLPHAFVLAGEFVHRWLRFKLLWRWAASQSELNELLAYPEYDLPLRMGAFVAIAGSALTFASVIPLLVPVAVVALVAFFNVERVLLLRFYRPPRLVDQSIVFKALQLLRLALFAHVAVTAWVYANDELLYSWEVSPSTFVISGRELTPNETARAIARVEQTIEDLVELDYLGDYGVIAKALRWNFVVMVMVLVLLILLIPVLRLLEGFWDVFANSIFARCFWRWLKLDVNTSLIEDMPMASFTSQFKLRLTRRDLELQPAQLEAGWVMETGDSGWLHLFRRWPQLGKTFGVRHERGAPMRTWEAMPCLHTYDPAAHHSHRAAFKLQADHHKELEDRRRAVLQAQEAAVAARRNERNQRKEAERLAIEEANRKPVIITKTRLLHDEYLRKKREEHEAKVIANATMARDSRFLSRH